jgi:ABC-type nitrate/sulfonate/bicarbonate transport system substrate-binding protein
MKGKLISSGAALLLSMLPSVTGAEPVGLRYGVIAASMKLFQSVPLYVAQRKGMLAREELVLDIVPLPGVEHMIGELDKGTVDISSTATPYLVQAALTGSDAVAVVGGPANTIQSLVSKPGITSFDQLRGKTVAVSLPIDVISIGTRQLLAKHGLREEDFVAKELIGTPKRANCLEMGDCAAAPLGQPDDIVFARKGFHVLGNSHEVIPAMQFTVVAARRTWAAQHKDALVRFARAMGEAYRFMHNPDNRDEVVAIAASTTGTLHDIAGDIYKLYYEPDLGVMPRQAEISLPGFSKIIELLGDAGALRPPLPPAERFVDLQFLQAAGIQ